MARRRQIHQDPRTLSSLALTIAIVVIYMLWQAYKARHAHPPTSDRITIPPTQQPVVSSSHAFLGQPTFLSPRPSDEDYAMDKQYFVLSYNNKAGTPNWVSWRLTRDDLGTAPRKQIFDPDASLPPGFRKVTSNDYTGSGFDRGHLCPHSDRAGTEAASFATFVMTNIIPQAPNVNQRAWEQLESYSRDLVKKNKRLHIAAGPAGQGGTGKNGFKSTIGKSNTVAVPASCWKIIVVADESAGDNLAAISDRTRVIAVLMPNDQNAVGDDWSSFRTSVANIESTTGLSFFSALPPNVASSLKNQTDRTSIPAPVKRSFPGGDQ